MRIRWRRRRPERPDAALPEGAQEARAAVASARHAASEAARRGPEVAALTQTLRRMRETNHFNERVEAMLRAGWHG